MKIILERRPEPEDDGPLDSDAQTHCPTCGAKTVEYRHTISVTQVRALRQLLALGGGPVPLRELGLTNTAYATFARLAHWQLIERVSPAVWRMTELGRRFLVGESVRAVAVTYRNDLVRYEGGYVTAETVQPIARGHDEYVADQIPHVPEPPVR